MASLVIIQKKTQTFTLSEEIKKVVHSPENITGMLMQPKLYSLIGIEHTYTPGKNGLCIYCSYGEGNINHI